MDGSYWAVLVERAGKTVHECVFARTAKEASALARRKSDGAVGEPLRVEMDWFHVEPILAEVRLVAGERSASLREQYFSGGKIACEAGGITFVFTPDLLPEPREVTRGGDETVIYGNAVIEAEGRPASGRPPELRDRDRGRDGAQGRGRSGLSPVNGPLVVSRGAHSWRAYQASLIRSRSPSLPSGKAS